MKDQFRVIVRRAMHQFVNEQISARLNAVLREGDEEEDRVEAEVPAEATTDPGDGVRTTDEEMEGFYIVRAILREMVDVSRVAHRDKKSYFGVLLDNNNRKPICRLHFNAQQKYLGLFDEEKNEERVPIDSLDDIYQHANRLKATIEFYKES